MLARRQRCEVERYALVCLHGLGILAVDGVCDISLHLLACGITQNECHALQFVLEFFLWQVEVEVILFFAQRQRYLALMRLTSSIGHLCFHNIVEHVITARRIDKSERYFKLSVLIRCHLAVIQFGFVTLIATPPAPPCLTALHGIGHLCALNSHSGVTLGTTFHLDGVAYLICLLVIVELHLERGALILLDIKRCIARPDVRTYPERACKSRGWQLKVGRSHTELISRDFGFRHLLVVSVTQFEFQLHVCISLRVKTFLDAICQHRYMNRLSGTVNRAVGIYLYVLAVIRGAVVGEPSHAAIRHGEIVVTVSRKRHVSNIRVLWNHHLALSVGIIIGERQFFVSLCIRSDTYLGISHRLSAVPVEHSKPRLVVRQRNCHVCETRYI